MSPRCISGPALSGAGYEPFVRPQTGGILESDRTHIGVSSAARAVHIKQIPMLPERFAPASSSAVLYVQLLPRVQLDMLNLALVDRLWPRDGDH
jgi:hypothetical protein